MILPSTKSTSFHDEIALFFHGEPLVFRKAMAGAVALPRPLAGSSVLELGAGPGLPGLAAAKMGRQVPDLGTGRIRSIKRIDKYLGKL